MRGLRCLAVAAAMLAVWTVVPRAQGAAADAMFDGSTLHDVWIHINSRDWAALKENYLENTYYPCDFEWGGVRVNNAGCRVRGHYSRNPIKPALRIEFDHYIAGQRFLGLSALALDNFWQDPSMIHERIAMQVHQRLGVPAPRESHARLFIGGARSYAGVYAIVEDINKQFLARQFPSTALGAGDEGDLFEYNWINQWGFEDLGSNLDDYAARFEAKTNESSPVFDLFQPFRDMVWVANHAQPQTLESDIAPYLDLRTLITQVAVDNWLSNLDGILGMWGVNNTYVYRMPGTTRATFIPWDQDTTFAWLDMPVWQNADANVLLTKVWQSPELRAFYLQQLVAVSGLSEWIAEEAVREGDQIREAALADGLKNSTNEEFEARVLEVQDYARRRGGVIQTQLESVAGLAAGVARARH